MANSTTTSLDERLTAFFAAEPAALAETPLLFSELRAHAPVYRHEVGIVFTGYDDVRTLLRDGEHLSKSKAHGSPSIREAVARMTEAQRRAYAEVIAFEDLQISSSDGAVHERLRSIAHRAFTPQRIGRLEASIRAYAEQLLDQLLE
jgi:cytochrome P450